MNQQGQDNDQDLLFARYIQQRLAGSTSPPDGLDAALAQLVEQRSLADPDYRLRDEVLARVSLSIAHARAAPAAPVVAVPKTPARASRFGKSRLKAPAFVAAAASIILAGAVVVLGPLTDAPTVSAEEILNRARAAAASPTSFKPFVMESVHEIVPADPSDVRSDRTRSDVVIVAASPSEWTIELGRPAMRAGPPSGPGMPAPLLPPSTVTTISNGEVVWSYDSRTGQVMTSPYSERWSMDTFPSVGNWERFRESDSLTSLLENHPECSKPQFLRKEAVAGREAYVVDLGQYACGAEPGGSNRMTVWIDAETYAVIKWVEEAGGANGLISTNQVVRLEFGANAVPPLALPETVSSVEEARAATSFPVLTLVDDYEVASVQRFCPVVAGSGCRQGMEWVETRYVGATGRSLTLTQGFFSRLGSVAQTETRQTPGGYEIDTRSLLSVLPAANAGRTEVGDSPALFVDCRAVVNSDGCRGTYFGQEATAAISWTARETDVDASQRYITLESGDFSVDELESIAVSLR